MNAIKKKQKDLIDFIFLSIAFYLWILFAFNLWNGDREGYEAHYYSRDIADWGVDIGYGYLNIFFRWLGFSYQEFQALIASLAILLLSRYIYFFSVYPFLSLLLYSLTLFPLDYVLLRSFLAFCVFLQGVFFLVQGKFYDRFIYILIVLLASLMHQSAFVLVLFAFIPVNRVISLKYFLFVFLLIFLSYFLGKEYLYQFEYYRNYMYYYVGNFKGGIYAFFVSLACTIVVFYSYLSIRDKDLKFKGASLINYTVFIFNINVFSLFFVFLYIELDVFIRLHRVVDFLNIVYFSTIIFYDVKNFLVYFFSLVFLSYFLVSYFLTPVLDMTVIPLLFDNMLLEAL